MAAGATLDIRLFGTPRFSYGQPIAGTLSPKTLAFFAYLLLHRETPAARETIAFSLWPDDTEEGAFANLRRSLYLLQRWLPQEAQWLLADRRSVCWNAEAPFWLDVAEYEHLVTQARNAEAAKLYSGDLLTSIDEEWITEQRTHYRNMQLRVLESLVAQLRESGDLSDAIAAARKGLQIDPWHEEFIREIIVLRALGGDRAGALGEYRSFEQALQREMGASPTAETSSVYERVRSGKLSESATPDTVKKRGPVHNLPAPISSFIGRSGEVDELAGLVCTKRLVTLVGSGGVGKTRLALRVAERIQKEFPDGAWFIDVTPLEDARSLERSVAATLKLQVLESKDLSERIVEELDEKRVLLLLDNCERLSDECAAFTENILVRCPNATVVATSRLRLGVSGEVIYEVAPLSESDASLLFCERAAGVGTRSDLTGGAATVNAVCAKLDGIPLAIELAAGRSRLLSIEQIHERLDDRFSLLRSPVRGAAPHQQTLRATIDWSYDLLEERERAVLDRLAVFSGSCSLEAIAAVCSKESQTDTLDVLEQLAEQSLVMIVPGLRENRYRLLDSVREYLLGKLQDRGEIDDARSRHLRYFTDFAEGIEPELTRSGQDKAMSALTKERDNLRAAFTWTTADRENLRLRLRLASALRWFYWFRGLFDLARERLSETLNAYGREESEIYARALATYGYFVLQQGDMDGAIAALQRALELCPREAAPREYAMIELQLGLAHVFAYDEAPATQYLQEGLDRARAIGDPWLISYALALRGIHAGLLNRRLESIALLNEALTLSEQAGESFQGTFWLLNLAVQQYHVDPSASAQAFVRCAQRAIQDDNLRAVAGCFEGIGWCMQWSGHSEEAARFLGAAEELRVRTSQPLLPQWSIAHDEATRALQDPACKAACARAWSDGAQAVREKRVNDLYEQAAVVYSTSRSTPDGRATIRGEESPGFIGQGAG